MSNKIKIGDEVRLTKAGIEERQKEFPGFKPSATTGFVTNDGFSKGQFVVAISDGELYSLPSKSLTVVKSAPKGYKPSNAPTEERVEQFTEDNHGSGIDYDWEIKETGASFRASNAFHTMDEHGGYDTVVPFTVIFPKNKSMEDFTLQFATGYQHQAQKHGLRSYLEDTFVIPLTE